jgi:CO/xanthine dehydrogenase Mo-binding subunit
LNACRDIRAQLQRMAKESFAIDPDKISVIPGLVRLPDLELTYADLMKRYYGSSRGEVISIGSCRSAYDPRHPLGGKPAFWELMCAAAEVEVDPETGATQVHKLVLVSDVGKALNPLQVEAQDEVAAMMGLGHTFMEELVLNDSGRILNAGALDYRTPTIEDIPLDLHSELIENADGPGPFGAKGAGEGGTLAIAAALGAAVNEAAGVAMRDLPLTPERIWRAIQSQRKSQPAT